MDSRTNYYGSLCSELYDILHPEAPRDELEFYLSYAEKGHSILEALCGSGRFLIPFAERGLSIKGMDNSREMLEKLRRELTFRPIFMNPARWKPCCARSASTPFPSILPLRRRPPWTTVPTCSCTSAAADPPLRRPHAGKRVPSPRKRREAC